MNAELIIVQIIIVLVGIYLAFTENKKNIYLVTFLFNLATLIMYLLKQDRAASVSCSILTVRAFIYLYKDTLRMRFGKLSSLIPIFFIILHIVLGGIAMENALQILSILAPALTTAYMWWGRDTQELRAGNFVSYTMWAIYEGCTDLYIVMASDAINAVGFAAAFIITLFKKRNSTHKEN